MTNEQLRVAIQILLDEIDLVMLNTVVKATKQQGKRNYQLVNALFKE